MVNPFQRLTDWFRAKSIIHFLQTRNRQEVFTRIYRENFWEGQQSLSGPGSDPEQTAIICTELPKLLQTLDITSLLDLPCGDFAWMKQIVFGKCRYIGADLVVPLIEANRQFETDGIEFRRLDLLTDQLPAVDLILCRDCLVHFSFQDIFLAVHNICRSGSTYFLTTSFSDRVQNDDILTGQWRPLNLMAPPFYFPAPLKVINEGCTLADGQFRDKTLSLWSVAEISQLLEQV